MLSLRSLFTAKAALLALALLSVPAHAQNTICPTPPTGDSSNRCASTAFVQNQIVSSGVTVGTTVVNGGTNPDILYNNNGILGNLPVTGTAGNVVLSTTPTMSGVTVTGSFTATGLVTNGDLTNPSLSVTGTSPIAGGGSVSLGGSTSISCPTCATSSGGGAITTGDVSYTAPFTGGTAETQTVYNAQRVSIMDFGAVADGSTAYSPGAVAVANQIALANAIATGKCVFIPFNLNGYSFSGSTTVNSNDCIQGEGQVLVKSQSSTSFLNVVGFNYPIVQISGLHIDMTGAGASSQAILLNNAAATVYAVQLYDLYFTNCVGAITDSGSFAHPIVDLRMARIRTALTLGTQIQIRSSQGFIHFNQVQIDNSNNVGAVTWDSINLGVVAGVEMNATDVTGPTTGTYQSGVYGIRITGTSSSAAVWMNRVNVDTTTGNGILISATTYVWLNNLDINNNLGNSLVLSTVTKGEVANSFLGGAIGRTGAAASASGIDLTSSSNVHFVNVSTENNTGSGFHINNSTDNLFSNIRSQGNTVDGFVELGTSDRNLVSNAVFDTNGTSDIVLLGANSRAVHYETSGSYVGSLTPWTVTSGGTGRATLTIHAPLVGEGTSGINQVTAGTNGQLFLGSTGIDPLFATMSQDCTITNAGVVTCLKTNNVSFGTAAVANTGTSGATIPLLNGNLTWSGTNAFNGGFSTGSSTPPNLITTGIAGGAPQTSGTTDANQFLTAGNGTVQWRFGFYANGTMWSQPSLQSNYATNVGTVFNPNGGNVGIGNTGSVPNSLLSVAGRTEAFNYISVGTVPIGTTGSCVASSFVGGATAGKFAAAVCAGGTIILSSLPAAPTGYTCNAQDQTTPADTLKQTANTTTSVTFTATTVAADVVVFSCVGW